MTAFKIKFGIVNDSGDAKYTTPEAGFLASTVLLPRSGRYVVFSVAGGNLRAVAGATTRITGYVDEDLTTSATSGVTRLPIAYNVDQFSTEMPYSFDGAAATLTQAVLNTLIGKLIDVAVIGNVQHADNRTTQVSAILRVTGGDVVNNTLHVTVTNAAVGQIA